MDIDRDSRRVLRYIYRRKTVAYSEITTRFPNLDTFRIMQTLYSEHLIETNLIRDSKRRLNFDTSAAVACSISGKSFIESRNEHDSKILRERITLLVAILALVLSLISIAWQAYTWKIERAELPESQSTAAATTSFSEIPVPSL